MIDRLLEVLAAGDIQLTPRELRDALWLAGNLTVPGSPQQTDHSEAPPAARPAPETTSTPVPHPEKELARDTTTTTAGGTSELYAAAGDGNEIRGVAARSPAVPALREKLSLARALRPLKKRVPSRTEFVVDEDATARRIADEDLWAPVFRPTTSRWLNLALVVDAAPSMIVWKRTVTELLTLADQLGAFRHVRVFAVDSSTSPGDSLVIGHALDHGRLREAPSVLMDPAGRQAVLVVTDAVGGAWRDGRMSDLLHRWGSTSATSVLTLLPQRMWSGTGLRATPVELHAPSAAMANSEWECRFRDANTNGSVGETPIPVLELSHRWLDSWARLVAGGSGWRRAAVLGRAQPSRHGNFSAEDEPAILVERFRAAASPTAFQLACYLSASWLNLPVMRLVQRVMLPDSSTSHLAEVFLGGLLHRCEPVDSPIDPELVQYEFADGVREALNSHLLRDDLVRVLRATSDFVSDRFGQTFDFAALLADPDGVALPALGAGTGRPLAHVAATVLAKLGGRYRTLSARLDHLERAAVAARAVGRIFLRDGRGQLVGHAAGSMVSPHLLITLHHVLPDAGQARFSQVQFGSWGEGGENSLPTATFALSPDRFFFTDESLDITLVALQAEPADLAHFGYNNLAELDQEVNVGDHVTVIQNPLDDDNPAPTRSSQIVDTFSGFIHYSGQIDDDSLGAPVFNHNWKIVALHRTVDPATRFNEPGRQRNEGTQVSRTLEVLRSLEHPPSIRTLVDELSNNPTTEEISAEPEPEPSVPSPEVLGKTLVHQVHKASRETLLCAPPEETIDLATVRSWVEEWRIAPGTWFKEGDHLVSIRRAENSRLDLFAAHSGCLLEIRKKILPDGIMATSTPPEVHRRTNTEKLLAKKSPSDKLHHLLIPVLKSTHGEFAVRIEIFPGRATRVANRSRRITRGEIVLSVILDNSVVVDLRTPVSGYISPIKLRPGSLVFNGQTIAQVTEAPEVSPIRPRSPQPPIGPFGPGSAMPLPGGACPGEDFKVKASVTALRYCTEESDSFRKMVAEVWFRTPDDAERVGFRPLT